MRKLTAKLTALMLMLNLVVCAPVSAYAADFEADPLTVSETAGTVTVAEEATLAEAPAEGTEPLPDQSVSVQFETEQALTEDLSSGSTPAVNADGTALEYETDSTGTSGEPAAVEEAFDLTAEITETETDAAGNLTDITYDVSLDQQTTVTEEDGSPAVVETEDVDQVWNQEAGASGAVAPQFKVELSVNSMDVDPTRVAHTYEENGETKTEYFYNEANKTGNDTGKKYFTVVKEAAETVTNKVVSLWTSFLGIFKITNDAFENQEDMSTSADLASAVNNAADGSTVEMLRDYSTGDRAVLQTSEGKGNNINVDLNGHAYEKTDGSVAVDVCSDGQQVTFQNGTIGSSGAGIYIWEGNSKLVLDDVDLKSTNGYIGIYSVGDSNSIAIENGSDITSEYVSVYLDGKSSALTVDNSTIIADDADYGFGIYSYGEGNSVAIQNDSTITSEKNGVYVAGKSSEVTVDNSEITADNSGYGVYAGTEGSNVVIQNGSEINSKYYGVRLNGNEHELALTDSSVNVSGNGYSVLATGSGNSVELSGSELTSGYMGIYSTGTENSFEIKDSSIDGVYGLGIYAPNSEVQITDSKINASKWGMEIGQKGNNTSIYTTVEGTTINAGDIGLADFGANNTFVIKDSNVNYGSSFGVYHNGSDGGAKFQIIGSYIKPTGTGGWGIYIAGSTGTANDTNEGLNSLTLKDTKVEGQTAVEVKFTDVTIDGSTLVGFGEPPEHIDNSSGTTTNGSALAVTDNSDGKSGGIIRINSGFFKGAADFDSIYQAVKDTTGDDKASVSILGGRYAHPDGLYKFVAENHATICYGDGAEYPYEVVSTSFVPSRSGYTFLGYKDADGNRITLAEAYAAKIVAYMDWGITPETPASAESVKQEPVIIVQPDSAGNNVGVTYEGSTAVVTVTDQAGAGAAISEVTITSVQQLREDGIDTVSIHVEEDVTLELDVVQAEENGFGSSIVVTRDQDTLTITGSDESQLTIQLDGLRAAAAAPVHIQYAEGTITIYFAGTEVFKVEVLDTLKANKELTVKLENGVLKLYDKAGTLLQEIKM